MTTEKTTKPQDKIRRITYVVIVSCIVIVFGFAGFQKFTNSEELVNNFSKWDLLKWKEVIGVIEILAVILYVIPKANVVGALLLTAAMSGAIYIHFSFGEPFYFEFALVMVIWINYFFVKQKKISIS